MRTLLSFGWGEGLIRACGAHPSGRFAVQNRVAILSNPGVRIVDLPDEKRPAERAFVCLAGGEGLIRACGAHPSGRFAVQNRVAVLSNPGVRTALPGKKKGPERAFVFWWGRGIDSRLRRSPFGGPLMRAFVFWLGGQGFEPGLAESESAVLPLDDPPVASDRCIDND